MGIFDSIKDNIASGVKSFAADPVGSLQDFGSSLSDVLKQDAYDAVTISRAMNPVTQFVVSKLADASFKEDTDPRKKSLEELGGAAGNTALNVATLIPGVGALGAATKGVATVGKTGVKAVKAVSKTSKAANKTRQAVKDVLTPKNWVKEDVRVLKKGGEKTFYKPKGAVREYYDTSGKHPQLKFYREKPNVQTTFDYITKPQFKYVTKRSNPTARQSIHEAKAALKESRDAVKELHSTFKAGGGLIGHAKAAASVGTATAPVQAFGAKVSNKYQNKRRKKGKR